MQFRQLGGLDVVDAVVYPHEPVPMPLFEVEHLRCDPRTWIGKSVPVSTIVWLSENCRSTDIETISPHGAHCLFTDEPGRHVFFLRLADEYHQETTWVKLGVPEGPLIEPKELSSQPPLYASLAGYDVLAGRLLLFVNNHIHILQY